MTNEPKTHHPKYPEIIAGLRSGQTDKQISVGLRVAHRTVARIRVGLGVPPRSNRTTLSDKLDAFSTDVFGGHTGWTGRTDRHGRPLIRHRGREIPASSVAFEQRAGRAPIGICKSECEELPHCLTPEHLMDELDRRAVRVQLRGLHGLSEAAWDVCPEGLHQWDEHGRVRPNLDAFCAACRSIRAARTREAKRAEGMSL